LFRILIDARIREGENPGIESFIRGLAAHFHDAERYGFEIHWTSVEDSPWLSGFISKNQKINFYKPRERFRLDSEVFKKPFPEKFIDKIHHPDLDWRIPREPEEIRFLNPDLIMFCSQDAYATNFPSIYHPHDLQHYQFPNFFTLETIEWRELAWHFYALNANRVVCGSEHVFWELQRDWEVPLDAIQIVSLEFPDLDNNSSLESLSKYGISNTMKFFLFPAAYYVHKNHKNLIGALKILINDGLRCFLILIGGNALFDNHVREHIEEMKLKDFIIELGFVSHSEKSSLFRNAIAVIVPSLYESKSGPVQEAMRSGVLTIASDIPGIREQLSDFPNLLFNPNSMQSISEKMKFILNLDSKERNSLSAKLLQSAKSDSFKTMSSEYYKLWSIILVP
jgi:glycosyltransferase involved in cell wall biosynthesis